MKKAIMLVLLLVMAIGMVPMLGHAECSPPEIGEVGSVCVDGNVITADGNDANPSPLSGWIQVDGDAGTICADDHGSPDGEDQNPTCVP